MEENICRYCHAPISEGDYFCPNCGKKLKDKPISTSVSKQALVYIVSALLPPFGLVWAVGYIRQKDNTKKSRNIVITIVVITAISLVLNLWWAAGIYNSFLGAFNSAYGGLLGN